MVHSSVPTMMCATPISSTSSLQSCRRTKTRSFRSSLFLILVYFATGALSNPTESSLSLDALLVTTAPPSAGPNHATTHAPVPITTGGPTTSRPPHVTRAPIATNAPVPVVPTPPVEPPAPVEVPTPVSPPAPVVPTPIEPPVVPTPDPPAPTVPTPVDAPVPFATPVNPPNPTPLAPTAPLPLPTKAPTRHVSFLKILAKTVAWLILILLSVVAFGAGMSHRYRIYHFLRTGYYTVLGWPCTIWLRSKIPFVGSSFSTSYSTDVNTILFDNDMNEGLLMRENEYD